MIIATALGLLALLTPSDSLVVTGRDASWSGALPPGAALEVQNAVGVVTVEAAEGDRAEVTAERVGSDWQDVRFELAAGPDGSVTICALAPDADWLRRYGHPDAMKPVGCSLGDGFRLGGIGRDEREVGVTFRVRVPAGVAVRVRSYDGDVEATVPGAFSSSDGDVYLDLSRTDRQSDVDVRTGDGDVTVRLAPGVGFDVDAASRDGSVRTDLPVLRDGRSGAVYGPIWGGGPALRIRTGDGTIRLREAL